MSFSKSKSSSIYKRREWQRKMQKKATEAGDSCGHVWEYDPEDRLMRCYKCGRARLPTDADELTPRVEGSGTDF